MTNEEAMDDLISRDAALDAFNGAETMVDVFYAIKDLPPVTPKHRTGHWVKISECPSFTRRWECSSCGCCHCALYDFCPSCGADMRGNSSDGI